MSSSDRQARSTMGRINVNWRTIRPINGSQRDGFEELCCQIADAERPVDTAFVRKGTPDAGVECYASFEDGREWGWQAKYFDVLGDAQWSELDDSVRTALESHPQLVRYYVCVPLDRPDARVEGRRSAKDRWDDRVKKWSGWARDREMDVEFVYWGSFELLERLSRPEHLGRLRFWFDVHGFDAAWFNDRLETAIKAAGPRYTPEIHVELPIAAKFEAFGRTEQFFDGLKAKARPLREKLRVLDSMAARGDFTRDAEKTSDNCVSGADELAALTAAVIEATQRILTGLGRLNPQPIGPIPFQRLVEEVDAALTATDALELTLRECEEATEERKAKAKAETTSSSYHTNPFRERRYRLHELQRELRDVKEALAEADDFAGASLLLLTGRAGTGKTHLLCDIARKRLQEGRPTVLLMGQRFLSNDDPWTQVLQHLDLAHLSAEEFVGALEAVAQVAGSRALVLIDALNEAAGRQIWPEHLTAFLAHLGRSEWISVALAVRSSYERIVIPEEIRRRGMRIEHDGFADHEYDAARTFFDYYGIERPSAPLLLPEFRNPLFLKVLCRGLSESGQRRLPRGFQGISATFNLFLDAVNSRLATELDFNGKRPLVRRAVEQLASKFVERGEYWLPLEEAEDVINSLLPGREFERSLYRRLVSEGVLVEEVTWHQGGTSQEVVQIAYERLADHLVAKQFLDLHLDSEKPQVAFEENGLLAYLADLKRYIPAGLVEALCVQIPERTGRELAELAPQIEQRWSFAEAFRQSLIWRAPRSFSKVTGEILNRVTLNDHDLDATLEVLVSLATVPQHPLNAAFLHKRLSQDRMPDRDAWWSLYLHRAWGARGAVNRLVEWAWSVTTADPVDEETVDLAATALAWMLTTSNRFLRDRATKALVSLLTGRLAAVVRLIERLADVDDLYAAERLYAVAYGCVMRSHDPGQVGHLAQTVYDRVFKQGAPPAHILLRDYARGVVERALYLGSRLDADPGRIRPPYHSRWSHIPTEKEIEPLKPDWRRGAHDSGDLEWARNRIGSSVLDDDFARYVIGTNSASTNWLSLRFDEPAWQSPDERLATLVEAFNEEEKVAWEAYASAERALDEIVWLDFIHKPVKEQKDEGMIHKVAEPKIPRRKLKQAREDALAKLLATLTPDHAEQIQDILAVRNGSDPRYSPSFDLRLIQRYIFWRVFDLGWTTKRFGHFDRFEIGYHGREASKAERIGKKYQWIAYHEIMALVSDHFQYCDWVSGSEGDRAYEGPWQDHFRDIDPSCTLRATPGGTSWDGHSSAWWGSEAYSNWTTPADHGAWVQRTDDLPAVQHLLATTNPEDGSRWLNLNGYFNWKQPTLPDQDPYEIDRREFWYICLGYLIRTKDVDAFIAWSEGVDFWGRWMPEPFKVYRMFLGEHVWSPAARYFQRPYYGDSGWTQPGHGCPVSIRSVSFEYLQELSGFDCSVDESYTLRLLVVDLIRSMGLRWSGRAGDYVDAQGRLIAFDPTAHRPGPSALLIQQEALLRSLEREMLSLVWTVLGEKRVIAAGPRPGYQHALRLSGAYVMSGNGPSGFLNATLDSGNGGDA